MYFRTIQAQKVMLPQDRPRSACRLGMITTKPTVSGKLVGELFSANMVMTVVGALGWDMTHYSSPYLMTPWLIILLKF